MKTYIELWNAKPAWHALSQKERGEYLAKVGPAIQMLLDKGIEIVSWGVNDAKTFNRAGYDFFGVWRVPNVTVAREFEQIVENAGWYDYFEQVNVMGDEGTPQDVIPKMVEVSEMTEV